ncbi:MAG TPA: hypothetical protein VGL42_08790 [Opitutaceae bacterium]
MASKYRHRTPSNHWRGFVKLQRTRETDELLRDRNAMALLTLIAIRARFTNGPDPINGLEFGEAQIGDFEECGLSRKEYRCALKRLVHRWKLISARTIDGEGTIAKILDSRVFSLIDERDLPKEGQFKGQHLSEEKSSNGATNGANGGPAQVHLGASNQKDQKEQKEHTQQPAAAVLESPSAYSRKPAARNPWSPAEEPICKALAEATGFDLESPATGGLRKLGAAARQILDDDPAATPGRVHVVAAVLRKRFSDPSFVTGMAIAKHWGDPVPDPKAQEQTPREPADWRAAVEDRNPDHQVLSKSWDRMNSQDRQTVLSILRDDAQRAKRASAGAK